MLMLTPTSQLEQALTHIGECPVTDSQITDLALIAGGARIETEADYRAAQQALPTIKQYVKAIEGWLDGPKRAAKGIYDTISAEVKNRTAPLIAAEAAIKRGLIAYEAEVRRANEEARRANEEARRAAEVAVEEGEVLPWEKPELVVAVQTAIPLTAGISTRNLPWRAEVTDIGKFLAWILENPADRLDFITINQTALNAKARSLGEKLGEVIPGTQAYRDQTVAVRG